MEQKLYIPKKENIRETHDGDSLICYYTPFVRNFYLLRFKKVIDYLSERKHNKILEIGYGSGLFLPELYKHTKELYACDIHNKTDVVEEMLKKENTKARLSCQDILSLKYKNKTFDGIICLSVLEHINKIDKALNNINKIAKKDADIIIGFPIKNILLDITFNLLLRYIIKSKGRIQDYHISSDIKILKEIKKRFIVKEIFRMPFIYIICRCKIR